MAHSYFNVFLSAFIFSFMCICSMPIYDVHLILFPVF